MPGSGSSCLEAVLTLIATVGLFRIRGNLMALGPHNSLILTYLFNKTQFDKKMEVFMGVIFIWPIEKGRPPKLLILSAFLLIKMEVFAEMRIILLGSGSSFVNLSGSSPNLKIFEANYGL